MNYSRVAAIVLVVICVSCLSGITQEINSHDRQVYYNVRNFGAVGNGTVYDTETIQKTIDSAFSNGGGTVFFPAGVYLTKTLVLKDNITLRIDNGATILGSTELSGFDPEKGSFEDSGGKKFGNALIFAQDKKNIRITGDGIIDGQGYTKYYPNDTGSIRPNIIRLLKCSNVKITDITLRNSAAWVSHFVGCEDLLISGVTIRSYSNKNNDGIDIVGCQRVTITNCNIDTEDDSIVLKALSEKSCRDIVISNCIVSGLKSAIKTGTESLGGFENITISNCTFYGTRGISLITVDGGTLNNVTISNISMRDSYAVIVMRLGNRMRPYFVSEEKRPKRPGEFKNVSISNVQAVNVTESNDFISGIPGYKIENVSIRDIHVHLIGGGIREDSDRAVPELTTEYPKAKMFGVLPSSGMYIRHAKNIKLHNIRYSYTDADRRSVAVCEDVDYITIEDLSAETSEDSAPFLQLKDTQHADIRFCKPIGNSDTFLSVEGSSGDITLFRNTLKNCKNKYILKNETDPDAVQILQPDF